MRRLLIAAALLGAVQTAQAADMPDFPVLRGSFPEGLSSTRAIWDGFYVGGQASYGSSNMNFRGANDQIATGLMAYSPLTLQDVPELGKSSDQRTGYGGFIGYNSQWEDVVLGLDASFAHGNFHGGSSPTPFRYINGLGQLATQASSVASVDMKDFGSLRGRAGYVIGNFLPYLSAGFALGRADIDRTVSLLGNFDPLVTTRSSQKDHFVYGYSVGAGVDVMLVAGFFLRAEYEYQRFATPVDININTVRGGLGYKF